MLLGHLRTQNDRRFISPDDSEPKVLKPSFNGNSLPSGGSARFRQSICLLPVGALCIPSWETEAAATTRILPTGFPFGSLPYPLVRNALVRHSLGVTNRAEIFTDGSFNDQTGTGGWAAVIARTMSGLQAGTSSYEMELRALVEAVKMADGPCTVISDYEGLIRTAQQGKTPDTCKTVWDELYAATAGKDVTFEWRRRDNGLGSRLAHQLARDAAKGR